MIDSPQNFFLKYKELNIIIEGMNLDLKCRLKIAFLIFKREKRLDLWAKACGDWHYIRSYHVRAAHGGPGPKLYRGDCQVPEGIYSIIELNPYSKFHLSMEINYPNYFDRMEAKQDHRVNLGNYIFIHGGNLSQGCIAMGDHVIEQLYVLVYKVGKQNVSIVIAPNDMRIEKPFMRHLHPPWLPTLYHHLAEVLQHFPEQRVLF